jgi:hypothetical protein
MKHIQPIRNGIGLANLQIVFGLMHSALRIPHTSAKRKRNK